MPTSDFLKEKYKGKSITPQADVERLINSAQRLGIEMDENEALQWLAAMAAAQAQPKDDVAADREGGVFGHTIAILNFSPAELAHFRHLGEIVGITDVPDQIETALALSGSANQSRLQSYPGDVDFFQRVNILAATQAEARRILEQVIRAKALKTFKGAGYQLIEVHFGVYARDVIKNGQSIKAGTPIAWARPEIEAGQFEVLTPAGERLTITWADAGRDPGWCKMDWVVADPIRGQVCKASNMLDATIETPDGSITPLDGFLDPYFQEVYLEADSIPIFSKLVKHVSADSLQQYVDQLEHQIQKYMTQSPNYGKVAKRLYNVFRLTGRYSEAAFIRELFDEPATLLYQVGALLDAMEELGQPGSSLGTATILLPIDQLIQDVIRVCGEPIGAEIAPALSRLRDEVAAQRSDPDRGAAVRAARQYALNLVNDFFRRKLSALPEVDQYLEWLKAK
jgi:hypothetical protein